MASAKPREVRGFGPKPNRVLFCGEAPGRQEYLSGRPFYGPSGQLQRDWLQRHGVDISTCYLTNIVKLYQDSNPDPSPDLISSYSEQLHVEIDAVCPWLIVAVGRFAARFFLGEQAELELMHGIPFVWPLSRCHGHSIIILPIYHPAFGLHSAGKGDYDALSWLAWDYQRTAKYIKLCRAARYQEQFFDDVAWDESRDNLAGQEDYLDCTGQQLANYLADSASVSPIIEIALDTEGIPSSPWSIQISLTLGTAYVLRCTQPDFAIGIAALQLLADNPSVTFITHQAGTPSGCMYDTIMCRAMGLELHHATTWDTMYAAFLLRTEARGLKHLAERWCGMQMGDYEALIGDTGRTKQLAYFSAIASITDWPPIAEMLQSNDGTFHWKKYQSPNKLAARALSDITSGKLNNKGEMVDPAKRWKDWDVKIRQQVVQRLGPLPHGTLDDLPLNEAVYYAGRDADATLRLKHVLFALLTEQDLLLPFADAMDCLPSMEEMQHTGMPASRNRFLSLLSHVQTRMDALQFDLIHTYNKGEPFNPNSPDHVRDLMHRRRLKGEKTTLKTGKVSTGKKSIDHLRHTDPAMALVTDWRELSTIRDTFVRPSLVRSNPDSDQFVVKGIIQPITTESRRLSMTNPTLLNIPSRTEIGRRVRSCYEIVYDSSSDPDNTENPDVRVFGAWDFAGQEAHVAGHVSGDDELIRIFSFCRFCNARLPDHSTCHKSPTGLHTKDIHSETAMRVFGVPYSAIDKWQHRMPAKTAFFGVLNGMSGAGLLDQFRMYIPPDKDPTGHWSVLDNCQSLVDEITLRVYPGLSRAMSDTRYELQQCGLVRDLFGFPRYLPAPACPSASFGDINAQVRAGFNHKIQGTAQGMTQSAQAYVYRCLLQLQSAGLDILFHLQIHDELLYSFPRRLWPTMNALVTDAMTNHYGRGRVKLCVPVECDGHCNVNWADLK